MLVAVCPGRFHYNFLILETMKILKYTIIRLIIEQSACPSQVELFEESLSEAREALRRQKVLSESVRICQMPCKILQDSQICLSWLTGCWSLHLVDQEKTAKCEASVL